MVPLRGTLGLRDAAELAATLETAIAGHPSTTIDAASLAGADFSILQVLAAARRSADAAGRTLRLKAPQGGALAQLLIRAGFVGPDGAPRADDESFWSDSAMKGSLR